jgi:hypothetical protein
LYGIDIHGFLDGCGVRGSGRLLASMLGGVGLGCAGALDGGIDLAFSTSVVTVFAVVSVARFVFIAFVFFVFVIVVVVIFRVCEWLI